MPGILLGDSQTMGTNSSHGAQTHVGAPPTPQLSGDPRVPAPVLTDPSLGTFLTAPTVTAPEEPFGTPGHPLTPATAPRNPPCDTPSLRTLSVAPAPSVSPPHPQCPPQHPQRLLTVPSRTHSSACPSHPSPRTLSAPPTPHCPLAAPLPSMSPQRPSGISVPRPSLPPAPPPLSAPLTRGTPHASRSRSPPSPRSPRGGVRRVGPALAAAGRRLRLPMARTAAAIFAEVE